MKRIIKTYIVAAIAAVGLLGTYSCVEPDDLITDGAKEGGLVVPVSAGLSFVGNPISITVETTEGISEVSFYKKYTKAGVATAEVFDQTLPVSGGAVSFTANYAALKAGLTGMPATAAELQVGDYWTFRMVSKLADGREIESGVKIKVTVDNPYSGEYHTTGSITRETAPGVFSTSAYEDDKALTTIDATTCETLGAFGFFANPGILFYLTVNPDNTVTINPSENPDRVADITGTPGQVSTYNPTTQTFQLYYEYTNASNLKRIITETLVRVE